MKTFSTLFVTIALTAITLTSKAQAPNSFNYQAVVRNHAGMTLTNQDVSIKISIRQGYASGPSIYTEKFDATTNQHGLINLAVGTGVTTDDFNSIEWANGPYFIETNMDANGGTNYTLMGSSQLMSVPYSLHAETADVAVSVLNDQVDDADSEPTNELQNLSVTYDSIHISEGNSIPRTPIVAFRAGSQVPQMLAQAYDTLKVNNTTSGPTFQYPDGIFNENNYTFTAPYAGIYSLSANMTINNLSLFDFEAGLYITVNGISVVGDYHSSNGQKYVSFNADGIVKLNAGDQVIVVVDHNYSDTIPTETWSGLLSSFSGELVHRF